MVILLEFTSCSVSQTEKVNCPFSPQNTAFWWVTQHGEKKLWAQRICWATNRKIYFLTTDPRVIMAIRRVCFLTTIHGHLPSPSYKIFFPDDTGFSYLLSKARGSKYIHLCRNHIHFPPNYTANTWLRACAHGVNLSLLWGWGQIGEQIRPKNSRYKLD